jgi:hypothetical protein
MAAPRKLTRGILGLPDGGSQDAHDVPIYPGLPDGSPRGAVEAYLLAAPRGADEGHPVGLPDGGPPWGANEGHPIGLPDGGPQDTHDEDVVDGHPHVLAVVQSWYLHVTRLPGQEGAKNLHSEGRPVRKPNWHNFNITILSIL